MVPLSLSGLQITGHSSQDQLFPLTPPCLCPQTASHVNLQPSSCVSLCFGENGKQDTGGILSVILGFLRKTWGSVSD